MTLARDPQERVDDGKWPPASSLDRISSMHRGQQRRRLGVAYLLAPLLLTLTAVGATGAAAAESDPILRWIHSRIDIIDEVAPLAEPADGSLDEATPETAMAAFHRSVAGRLLLAFDSLAELDAFAPDEDPGLDQAVIDIARIVPTGGLEALGYRQELAVLEVELPEMLAGLDAPLSPGILDVMADLDGDLVERLDAGDTAFVDPLPWLESIADVLMRGGGELQLDTDQAHEADDDAVFDFVWFFSDPGVFEGVSWTEEMAFDDIIDAPISTSTPDLALVTEAAADDVVDPASDEGPPTALLAGILAAVVAAVATLAAVATRKRPSDAEVIGDDGADQPVPREPAAVVTLPIAPPPEEPGSLVELLDASRRMTASLDATEIAAIAVAEARNLVKAEGGILLRRSAKAITPIASSPSELFTSDDLESSMLRKVVDTGQSIYAAPSDDPALVDVPAAVAAVALVANGSVIGALMVVRRSTRPFSSAEVKALEMLAPLVGSALLAAQTHGSATALADLDALTGLANRRSLDRDIGALRSSHVASYVMIDVDHFKVFNDTNGHAAGDVALRTVARAIESNVRPEDRVYRYGGEEFCVLLPGASSNDAAQVAERVRAAVEASVIPGGERQPSGCVTISIGVADTEAGIDDIIERADAALYEAKESGRNRVNIAGSTIR